MNMVASIILPVKPIMFNYLLKMKPWNVVILVINMREKQSHHSKVKNIEFTQIKTQQYITSQLFSNVEAQTLFSLRTRMINCKSNFKNNYNEDDMICPVCNNHYDSQENMLVCEGLTGDREENPMYSDICSPDIQKQKEIARVFVRLLDKRSEILENAQDPLALPGQWNVQKTVS